jgi:NAD(P)-dependent dehydrogenase (short-subunit alcohol dehydrogenase family)
MNHWHVRNVPGDDVLLVTGGSRGIGAAVARRAASHGWSVCLTYKEDELAAQRVAADIAEGGSRVRIVRADISDESDVISAFEAAESLGRLSALVANAGVVAPKVRLEDMTAERVMHVLSVNVFGTIMCCREAVRRMSRSRGGGGGAIVLVSSAASRIGSAGEYVDYAATKGAIDSLGLGLAAEVAADGIRVNVVRPGITDTDIHARNGQPDRLARMASAIPLGRPADPDEVARSITWLASEEASYCTGSILDVAGGR